MIKQIRPEDIPRSHSQRTGYTKTADDVSAFLRSGKKAVEIKEEGARVDTLYHRYYVYTKRLGHPVKVIVRGDRVFMVRNDG